jgi:hypothetical protein
MHPAEPDTRRLDCYYLSLRPRLAAQETSVRRASATTFVWASGDQLAIDASAVWTPVEN